jgi:hypothetical protein
MKALCVILVFCVILGGCQSTGNYYHTDDPFSEQLDYYYNNQQKHKKWFVLSALAFAGTFAFGTYFATNRSLGNDSLFNNIGFYSSYALAAGAFAFGGYTFYQWSTNNDLYLETLRLQTQYYNVLQP